MTPLKYLFGRQHRSPAPATVTAPAPLDSTESTLGLPSPSSEVGPWPSICGWSDEEKQALAARIAARVRELRGEPGPEPEPESDPRLAKYIGQPPRPGPRPTIDNWSAEQKKALADEIAACWEKWAVKK
jgi:hypothetical protein